MWINPRLTSKLAESYTNGAMSQAFNGNSYLSNGFNNYNGNENWVQNQNFGENTIHSYNGNPDGLTQQMRFNEIANQVLNQQREFESQASPNEERPNRNLLEFANSLTHPFNNRTYGLPQQMMTPSIFQNQNISQPNMNQPLNPNISQPNMNQPLNQNISSQNIPSPNISQPNIPSPIHQSLNQKNMNSVLVIICVAFALFLFIQLYLNQKRLEYMITLYRDMPVNSPYYTTQRFNNQYEHE